MTGQVIPAFVIDVHRDLKAGVDIQASVEQRLPSEVRDKFIAAMRQDVEAAKGTIRPEVMRAGFQAMGLPDSWIDEVLA